MSPPSYDGTGVEYYTIPSFKFVSGSSINIRITYRCFNPSAPKTVCIPTCYGGRINTTLSFTAEDQALRSYRVIVVAMLGNGESSSPSNHPNFPKDLDYRDCINAQYQLLTNHLNVKELEAVIGFSMGGQQAYHWACMYPQFMKYAVPICSSAKTSLHNYAFIEGPKAALTNSIDYDDGAYRTKGIKPTRGLRAFGRTYCAWAMSAPWFRQRQFEKLGFTNVEDFIKSNWEDAFEAWDPEDLLILARMWQAGDIGKTREDGDYLKALEAIEAKVLVMPSRTDTYFPPEDSEIEVQHLKQGELAVIETVWGHMAGGGANEDDTLWMNDRIAKFIGTEQSLVGNLQKTSLE
ncbi:MAG: hypothetical protein L6R38_006656 [Xanthoria sp. 2 TBL-2021]|nr:MAG: hypothetical protein L6R38_006656 [Xanthoria sp. 2 TBL-2021]